MSENNGKFYKDKFLMGLMACIGASFVFTAGIWGINSNSITKEAEARVTNDKEILYEIKSAFKEQTVLMKEQVEIGIDNKIIIAELARDIEYIKKKIQ